MATFPRAILKRTSRHRTSLCHTTIQEYSDKKGMPGYDDASSFQLAKHPEIPTQLHPEGESCTYSTVSYVRMSYILCLGLGFARGHTYIPTHCRDDT